MRYTYEINQEKLDVYINKRQILLFNGVVLI